MPKNSGYNKGDYYCLKNTWKSNFSKPISQVLKISVIFNSLRNGSCINTSSPSMILFCPAKTNLKTSSCYGVLKRPFLYIDSELDLKAGLNGWAWAGIIGGVVLLGAVVFLVLRDRS